MRTAEYWGIIGYEEALCRQKTLVRAVARGAADVLVFCEHPLTVTMGRASRKESILFSRQDLLKRGFSLCSADRGGDVTLHAPGQMVAYPVINLKASGRDIRSYLKNLEQVAIDFLQGFGIVAKGSSQGATDSEVPRGVWVGRKKIASIGIGVSQWVTFHGMALNVNNDLDAFRVIRPCGLDVRMTSVKEVLGRSLDMAAAQERFLESFSKVFGHA
jgi:lipoate-protein ligase B